MDKYLFLDNTFFMIMIVAGIPCTIHFIKVFSKKPYKNKTLPIVIFFLLLISNLIFGVIIDHNDYENFSIEKANTEITKIRSSKNSRRYWLKNDMVMKMNSPYSVDLQLKDHIVKDSNSNYIRVYRQNSNRKYVLKYTFSY